MSAVTYNLVIDKGATFQQRFTWKDSDGAVINLTGYTARMHIRETIAAATTIVELTTENGRITLGGVAGTIDLEVAAAVTAAITQSSGFFDLEMVAPSGKVTRLVQGRVQFSPETTR